MMTDITIDLNVLDEEGYSTGETRSATLSIEAIQDIVNNAAELRFMFDNQADGMDLNSGLIGLCQALENSGILEDAVLATSKS